MQQMETEVGVKKKYSTFSSTKGKTQKSFGLSEGKTQKIIWKTESN